MTSPNNETPFTGTFSLSVDTYAQAEEVGTKAIKQFFPDKDLPHQLITKVGDGDFVFTASQKKGACEKEHQQFLNNLDSD